MVQDPTSTKRVVQKAPKLTEQRDKDATGTSSYFDIKSISAGSKQATPPAQGPSTGTGSYFDQTKFAAAPKPIPPKDNGIDKASSTTISKDVSPTDKVAFAQHLLNRSHLQSQHLILIK